VDILKNNFCSKANKSKVTSYDQETVLFRPCYINLEYLFNEFFPVQKNWNNYTINFSTVFSCKQKLQERKYCFFTVIRWLFLLLLSLCKVEDNVILFFYFSYLRNQWCCVIYFSLSRTWDIHSITWNWMWQGAVLKTFNLWQYFQCQCSLASKDRDGILLSK
jgi:hypothetical protein